MSEAKREAIYGPEPWQREGGAPWSHWDLWFCLVAHLDHGGDLVALAERFLLALAAELRDHRLGYEADEALQNIAHLHIGHGRVTRFTPIAARLARITGTPSSRWPTPRWPAAALMSRERSSPPPISPGCYSSLRDQRGRLRTLCTTV